MSRRGRDAHTRSNERSALRRRAKRQRRRDTVRSSYYEPIQVDSKSASRGIRTRLLGGATAGALTLLCWVSIVIFDPTKFALLALVTLSVGTLTIAISLILSARREEIVHQIATDLHLDDTPLLSTEGEDLVEQTLPSLHHDISSSSSPTHRATDGSV